VFVNRQMADMLGYSRDEMIGRSTRDFAAAVETSRIPRLRGELRDGERVEGEFRWRRRDGALLWTLSCVAPMYDDDGAHVANVGMHADITARKLSEDALRRSNLRLRETLEALREAQARELHHERLAAVGQLAAGLAHDFNNVLTGILGQVDLLQRSSETPATMQPTLHKISASSQRAAHWIRQLLDYTRKSIRHPEPIELAALVREHVAALRRAAPARRDVLTLSAAGDELVEADAAQLRQVITNLVENARDATPDGGEIALELTRRELAGDERCAVCSEPIRGSWLALSIADRGRGVPPTLLPRIFEPYFTTKEAGRGTGLGLAQVAGIVEQSQGHVAVRSELDRGTTFTVYLAALARARRSPQHEARPPVATGQRQVVLVVEDEESVLDTIKTMLEHLSYQVITAANGLEALETYRARRADIALTLSDMVMPNMDGESLFRALRAEDPAMRMILMSGYPLEGRGPELLAQGVVAWLEKPFSVRRLSQVVSAALSER
ncbi:MAG: response regulator, partial [Myxococcales bacterium]|nr:response regulator [Myxococcales bacterium]